MRIDPHVHFRDEEQAHKETIRHGLSVAKEQGVDIVFDMPNTLRPVIDEKRVRERLALVPKGEEWRYYTYIGATKNPDQLKKAIELIKSNPKVIGIKMFAGKSTGTLEIISEEDQKNVYQTLANANYTGVIVVHCEKESFLKNIFDPKNPITHSIARPKEAEIESVKDQIKFAKEAGFKGTLHICHTSCAETIELVQEAKKNEKVKVTCGVTPHHAMWSNEKMNEPQGLLYKINPPLRNPSDVIALQQCLKAGKVDWIETDHAPHTIEEKLLSGYPSGYPSLCLYKDFVEKFLPELGLNQELIEKMTFSNIKDTFGLKI
jgi:dihydroorotase